MSAYCSRCETQNSTDAQFCIQCGGDLGALPVAQPLPLARVHYAGFWLRFLAAFIDGIIIQVVIIPISIVIQVILGATGASNQMPMAGLQIAGALLTMPFSIIGAWLYEAKMESSPRQATLGKMIFSMKVMDMAGQRISSAGPVDGILPSIFLELLFSSATSWLASRKRSRPFMT
jgi:hypothetical protein